MSKAVLGALVGAGLVIAAAAVDRPTAVYAQRATTYPSAGTESGMVAIPGPIFENGQLVTVVDGRARSMAVYRVDATTGNIKLLAVRNINWDLQMMQLNSEKPLPQEIRALLDQR
jgi:hypothetical protein